MNAKQLDLKVLLAAYSVGYFPMPDPDTEEIRWYFPDPRAIIPLDGFHVSRSLAKTLKSGQFTVTIDKDFKGVMAGCAERSQTWINDEFKRAYSTLHALGIAHSVEVWEQGALVGGVYGVALGGAFFAESKFHRQTDASKVALHHLVEHLKTQGFQLLEVQFLTAHLARLGAVEVAADDYLQRLGQAIHLSVSFR